MECGQDGVGYEIRVSVLTAEAMNNTYCLLRRGNVQPGVRITTFWRNLLSPSGNKSGSSRVYSATSQKTVHFLSYQNCSSSLYYK